MKMCVFQAVPHEGWATQHGPGTKGGAVATATTSKHRPSASSLCFVSLLCTHRSDPSLCPCAPPGVNHAPSRNVCGLRGTIATMKGCRGRLGIGRPNGVKAVRKRGSRREVCEHGKQMTRCIECAQGYTRLGSRHAICQHGKRRTRCIVCGGGSLCDHGKPRTRCIKCTRGDAGRGGRHAICQHGKKMVRCIECRGHSICYRHTECGGKERSSISAQ